MDTPTPFFDRALSLRLDALIIALDAAPRLPRRVMLMLCKRWLERAVPYVGTAVRP